MWLSKLWKKQQGARGENVASGPETEMEQMEHMEMEADDDAALDKESFEYMRMTDDFTSEVDKGRLREISQLWTARQGRREISRLFGGYVM